MTTDISLLPPNATQQERDIETAMRAGVALRAAIDLIRTAKENPPDDFVLWLVYEYGLAELLPYIADPRIALNEGLAWQRLRGTPESLAIAFPWIGLPTAAVDEESATGVHWYEYQVATGKVLTVAEIKQLFGLATISAPVGTRLSRMYYGLDLRRAIYDETAWSDGSLWSADSGVIDPDTGVIISFGRLHQTVVSVSDGGTFGIYSQSNITTSLNLVYDDRMIHDYSTWGDAPTLNYDYQANIISSSVSAGIGRNIRVADGIETANGTTFANGGTRTEQAPYPASWQTIILDTELHGWSVESGWSDTRTWSD